ncbi:DUF2303 family protein [Notoacmeibacter sp. MSK16QG-6]|uniref:DUF2303 family protein n=1 Tax=Notoacmeibacter sp. MSK16QG-6 TaxID=2957982 RepID=UPI00209F4E67|nr:DUF2303 family protein [Notoacmeibacter sp. MSK16QG-6]MCP1200091.1 YfdQ family protein [Notoacmeibacter sp. MSK16QG-6]
MSDNETESGVTGEATATLQAFAEPIRYTFDGDAIERIAELGQAANSLTIEELDLSYVDGDEDLGLPTKLPIGVRRGSSPMFVGLKDEVEKWRTRPARRKGQASAGTLSSFCDLINRHIAHDWPEGTSEAAASKSAVVFADSTWTAPSLTAVLNYHGVSPDQHGFGDHRIHYAFPLSEEWKAWVAANGEAMTQEDFALFLEDHIQELASPDEASMAWVERDFQGTLATPSKLMELSRGLQVNVNSKVKNEQKLQSGEGSIVFEEEHTGRDGEALKIPSMFLLRIAPFFMGEETTVPVRLRYRVRAGSIVWFFQLWRPDKIITEEVRRAMAMVEDWTGLPVYEGMPEMPSGGRAD